MSRSTMARTKASVGGYLGLSTQFCGFTHWHRMTILMSILNTRVLVLHPSLFTWIMHILTPQPRWNFQVTTATMSPWATWFELYVENTMIWRALYSVWISAKHLWRFSVMASAYVYHFPLPIIFWSHFSSFTPLYHYAARNPTGRPYHCTKDRKFGSLLVTRKAIELIWWPWDANPALFQCSDIHTSRLRTQTL